MTISQRGTAVVVAAAAPSNTMTIQGTWPTGSTQTAGDLLVAVVTAYDTAPAAAVTGLLCESTGWTQVAGNISFPAGAVVVSIWTAIAVGGDTAPTFLFGAAGTAGDESLQLVLYDLLDSSGATPQVATVGLITGTSGTITPVTAANVPSAGCFGIAAAICSQGTTAATTTWTPPTGWQATGGTQTTSLRSQMAAFSTSTVPSSGAALSCLFTHSRTSTNQTAAIIVVQPPVATAVTVTATTPYATGTYPGIMLTVKVLTGAAMQAPGTTATSGSGTTQSLAITPSQTGSWVYGAVSCGFTATAFTAATGTTFSQNQPVIVSNLVFGTLRTTSTDTAATPVTLGGTATGGTAGATGIALCEITKSGTLAEDASSPPALWSPSGLSISTVSFTPPAGSLLVAQVAIDGTGAANAAVTVAGGGLIWTENVNGNGNSGGVFSPYAGIWTASVNVPVNKNVVQQAVKRASLW